MPGATAADRVPGLLFPLAPCDTGAGMPGGPLPNKVGAVELDDAVVVDAAVPVVLCLCCWLKFFGFLFNTFKIAE